MRKRKRRIKEMGKIGRKRKKKKMENSCPNLELESLQVAWNLICSKTPR